jgi:hypothetical protein
MAALRGAILNKPMEHNLIADNKSESSKMMYQIGG